MSTEKENRTIIRRFVEEVWNQGNMETVDELIADDFIIHDSMSQDINGIEGVKSSMARLRTAFPDLYLTVEDEIVTRERVVIRYTVHGTHKGEFLGIPPTGNEIAITGISISRIVDGKLVENWRNWDPLSLMRQLGLFEL